MCARIRVKVYLEQTREKRCKRKETKTSRDEISNSQANEKTENGNGLLYLLKTTQSNTAAAAAATAVAAVFATTSAVGFAAAAYVVI